MLRTDLEIITELPITAAEKLLMTVLLRFRNGRTGQCNPSKATIAEMVGCQERWVYTVLRKLKRAGYVDVVEVGGGSGRTTNYVLKIHENPALTNSVFTDNTVQNTVQNTVLQNNRNKEEILNTRNTGNTATHGATNQNAKKQPRTALDRAIANIDRVCGS